MSRGSRSAWAEDEGSLARTASFFLRRVASLTTSEMYTTWASSATLTSSQPLSPTTTAPRPLSRDHTTSALSLLMPQACSSWNLEHSSSSIEASRRLWLSRWTSLSFSSHLLEVTRLARRRPLQRQPYSRSPACSTTSSRTWTEADAIVLVTLALQDFTLPLLVSVTLAPVLNHFLRMNSR